MAHWEFRNKTNRSMDAITKQKDSHIFLTDLPQWNLQ